jgi:periplasmic protein TonB
MMKIKKSEPNDLDGIKPILLRLGLVLLLSVGLFITEFLPVFLILRPYSGNPCDGSDDCMMVTSVELMNLVKIPLDQETPTQPKPLPAIQSPPAQPQSGQVDVVSDNTQISTEISTTVDSNNTKGQGSGYQPITHGSGYEGQGAEAFMILENTPTYPGGDEALMNYLKENLKYPQSAREGAIEGVVQILFIVEKDGSISNAEIYRDIGSGCGAEALRIVNQMPKWTPAKQRGKPIRTQVVLPIKFILSS